MILLIILYAFDFIALFKEKIAKWVSTSIVLSAGCRTD